jgi:hypothetical protein
MFKRFDSNHDGILSWDEAWAAAEPIHEKIVNNHIEYKMKTSGTASQFEATCK